MAIKVQTDLVEVKAGEAPAVLGSDTMQATAPAGNFLPSLSLLWPITVQNNPTQYKMADAMHMVVASGEGYQPLNKPYTLVAIASRNASREVVKGSDGEVTYNRAYGTYGSFSTSNALYLDHLAKNQAGDRARFHVGGSFLVAILTDEGCAIAQFDIYKSAYGYWYKCLAQATLASKLGAQISVLDHSVNLKTNETGSFLDRSKFKQFTIAPLTKKQLEMVAEAVRDAEEEIGGWVKR